MVAAQRAGFPLYQQQESPSESSPSPSPSMLDMSREATLTTPPAAHGTSGVLQGDHSTKREPDVTVDIGEGPKSTPSHAAQAVAADTRQLPQAQRKPFHKDPFGWVLRPRAISKHQRFVLIIFGRIGWCAKAIIYSIIGGLCCKSSVQGRSGSASASPQGAFILIGNNDVGVPLLVILAVMLALYAGWRFWEGIIGAGTDADVGKAKNFFRYRLSPMVSGAVYLAYMAYILSLLAKNKEQRLTADDNRAFPNSWRNSDGGKFGLALIGIAFICAFLAQIEMILTPAFHRELRPDLNCFLKWTTIISGHIGFSGRAGTFLLVSILFFRTIEKDTGDETTIANALYQLQGNAGGRFALFLLGWGLIVYGLYATMCGLYVRVFPTKPRSSNPVAPLQHARHFWNARRERKLQQRAEMMQQTLGLEINGTDGVAQENGNGHAVANGSDGTMTEVTNSWAPASGHQASQIPALHPGSPGPYAEYSPSRVFVPPSSVAQI